jgi:hypothetical protein
MLALDAVDLSLETLFQLVYKKMRHLGHSFHMSQLFEASPPSPTEYKFRGDKILYNS